MPRPTPEFQQSDVIYCPSYVSIREIGDVFNRNKPFEFSAQIHDEDSSRKLDYVWEVSTGKIIEGQGTEKIKVDVREIRGDYIITRLTIKGYALECNNQATDKVIFATYPFKLAEFKDESENLKIYPLILYSALKDNPQLEAKIFIYGARNTGVKSIAFGEIQLKKFFKFMAVPMTNISTEIGGYREDLTFEMWLYPKGTKPPKPIPSVDEKFVVFTDKTKKKTRKRR